PSAISSATRRQALAVESYSRELCPPEAAAGVADEVLGSFTGDDNVELLRHTRRTAAKHADVPSTRKGWRRSDRNAACQATPGLLAARANDELDDARGERLEHHLNWCLICQAVELRARRAERAFAGVAGIALPAAATVRAETAPPP